MLREILNKGCLFKPINGGAVQDKDLTERFCYIYSMSGAALIDVRGESEIIHAAVSGIRKANKQTLLIASVSPMPDDPHFLKAFVEAGKCNHCGKCLKVCPHNAVKLNNGLPLVDKLKCRGCSHCLDVCSFQAIEMVVNHENYRPLKEVTLECITNGADTIEFHLSGMRAEDVYNSLTTVRDEIRKINDFHPISACLGSLKSSPSEVLDVVDTLSRLLGVESFFLQMDGETMSDSRYGYGLQSLALADFIKKTFPKVWVIVSGGTTEKTWKIARLLNIPINGVGMGLRALAVIKSYINQPNLYNNCHKAVESARSLFSPYGNLNQSKDDRFFFKGTALNSLKGIKGGIR